MNDAEDQHRHAQEHADQAHKTPQQEGSQPHGLGLLSLKADSAATPP
jgi:hypothetical protein